METRRAELPCSQCGGPLPIPEHVALARCPRCGETLYLDAGGFVLHGIARPQLDARAAARAVAAFLEALEIESARVSPAAELSYEPWYRVAAPGRAAFVPAAAAGRGEHEFADVLATCEVAPFDAALVNGVPVTWPEATFDEARERVVGGDDRRGALVHAPVWTVRYRWGEREFVAHVDGVLGRVAADAVPPSASARRDRVAVGTIAVLACGFAAIAWLLPGVWAPLLAIGVVSMVIWTAARRRAAAR
jgi:hypothetical protein